MWTSTRVPWQLLPAVLLAIAVASAVACGGDGEEKPTPTPTATPVAEPTAPPTPEAVRAVGTASPGATPTELAAPEPTATQAPASTPTPSKPVGGVFRRLWDDPPTLDPHLTSDTTSAAIVVEIFGGLITFGPNLELIGDIAERWDISEDGQIYTFYLRPEAKFHDGKPVTAQDFKWSLERAANPTTGSAVADTYLGDIIGAQDVLDGKATEISGVTVIDGHTLQITIDAPKAYFLAKMTYPTAFVLDRENVESGGRIWTDQPNGTGPFKLGEYRIGELIVLERNENFHRERAYLDRVVMNLAGGQSMAMYENDEIDITGVGLLDLDRVLDPSEDLNKEVVVAPPDFSVFYLGFNTSMPPFDDVKFRQALNHAVDKDFIAAEIYSGLLVPAHGILPPGFPGHNPDLEGLRYDPDLAQRLFNESSYTSLSDRDRRNPRHLSGSDHRDVAPDPGCGGGDPAG